VSYRILVTGSRDWIDVNLVRVTLWDVVFWAWPKFPISLVHGACQTGADAIADRLWLTWMRDFPGALREPERFPADWGTHSKAAGPIRNAAMVATLPNICIAFPLRSSRGTWDCIDKAKAAGIETRVVTG
jgi:hypothetical protein